MPYDPQSYICPNLECVHSAFVHDGDGNDEPFQCCVEGCDCGRSRLHRYAGHNDDGDAA